MPRRIQPLCIGRRGKLGPDCDDSLAFDQHIRPFEGRLGAIEELPTPDEQGHVASQGPAGFRRSGGPVIRPGAIISDTALRK